MQPLLDAIEQTKEDKTEYAWVGSSLWDYRLLDITMLYHPGFPSISNIRFPSFWRLPSRVFPLAPFSLRAAFATRGNSITSRDVYTNDIIRQRARMCEHTSNFSSEFTKNGNRELILREAKRDELAYYEAPFSLSLSLSLLGNISMWKEIADEIPLVSLYGR